MKITHREFLPSFTKSVHASTVEIWNDHPVFAWFGGPSEGDPDVNIYLYNLTGNQQTMTIGQNEEMPKWNPILVKMGHFLILFEKSGVFCDRWQTFIHDITHWDEDTTQKEIYHNRTILPAGLNGPVKSRPLIVGDIMYCGSSVETAYDWTSYIEEYIIDGNKISFNIRSAPLTVREKVLYTNRFSGKTARSLGIIQPTLWLQDDGIKAFFRSSKGLNGTYFSERTYDFNGDEVWSQPVATNLPNPNSAVDVAMLDGRLFLVFNPDENERFPLVVSEIERVGNTPQFQAVNTVIVSDDLNRENFYEKDCNSPELSYPYMIAHDGKLHLTYTYGRKFIEYCIIQI